MDRPGGKGLDPHSKTPDDHENFHGSANKAPSQSGRQIVRGPSLVLNPSRCSRPMQSEKERDNCDLSEDNGPQHFRPTTLFSKLHMAKSTHVAQLVAPTDLRAGSTVSEPRRRKPDSRIP